MTLITFWSRVGLLLLVTSVASCSPPNEGINGKGPYPSRQTPAPHQEIATSINPVQDNMHSHWIKSAELRSLMKELPSKIQRHSPDNLLPDYEEQRGRPFRDAMGAAKLADGLAAAAALIPASVASAKMSEADRAGFQAEADTLRDQAVQLGQGARANDIGQVQTSLDAINTTCISCHSRYHDFSGQLDVRQISGNQFNAQSH